MNIDDILDEIEAKMFEMGFEENDEINKDGIELERLYDNIFHNNKEVQHMAKDDMQVLFCEIQYNAKNMLNDIMSINELGEWIHLQFGCLRDL